MIDPLQECIDEVAALEEERLSGTGLEAHYSCSAEHKGVYWITFATKYNQAATYSCRISEDGEVQCEIEKLF